MVGSTLERLAGSRDDARGGGLLALLHNMEIALIQMISGIWWFLWETTPDLLRQILSWLQWILELAIRISVRLVRVAAVGFAWFAIVWGPLLRWPGMISVIWTAIAVAGSVYGLRRRLKPRPRVESVYGLIFDK